MRKIGIVITTLVFALILISCGPRTSVKGYFLDIDERTTSIIFSIELEDPNDEITGDVIVELIDVKTNAIVNSKTLYQENEYSNINFTGLDNKGDYKIDVRVTIGRESKVVVSHDVDLQSLETKVITSVEDFMDMASNPEGNYELGQSIDFSNVSFLSPFGSVSKTFSGTFDGKGYTLSNITFGSITGNVGLFGYVSSGTIKNLNINNVKIGSPDARLTTQTASKIGVLAGYVSSSDAVIENISIDQAEIYVTSSSSYQIHVGGIFGDLRAVAKNIEQRNVMVDVLTTSYAKVNVGGVAGFVGEQGGLRQVLSYADIYQEVIGDYVDISTKTWNINVGGVVGDFNSRLSRGLQDVIHTGNINVDLDFGTPSGQKGTYDVYIGGLTGRSYGQIYQAMYEGSIALNHTENEFESSIIKSFYVGGISGYYESNFIIDHVVYFNNTRSIDLNVSEDSKVYLSYTVGAIPITLNHEFGYTGEGTLTKNGSAFVEVKPSPIIDSLEGYFTSEFMTSPKNE